MAYTCPLCNTEFKRGWLLAVHLSEDHRFTDDNACSVVSEIDAVEVARFLAEIDADTTVVELSTIDTTPAEVAYFNTLGDNE